MSNIDIGYLYNEDSYLSCKCLALNQEDSVNIYLYINIRHKMKDVHARNFKIFYWLTNDYRSSNVILSDTFRLKIKIQAQSRLLQHKHISFKIPKLLSQYSVSNLSEGESGKISKALLIIGIKEIDKYTFIPHKKERFICEIPINFNDKFSNRSCLFDKTGNNPLFKNFINITDTILIKFDPGYSEQNLKSRLYVYHYDFNFIPASPPMAKNQTGISKSMKIDTLYSINSNSPLTFDKTGLYFVQQDTNGTDGFSILVLDGKYPRVTKVKEMLKPLIYIITTEERNRLNNLKNTKKTLNDFWLDIARDENYARRLIKLYYKRVEFTNRNFTSFKEGWKTDRGMIYIIYGKPEGVYKFDDKEKWVYSKYVTNQWDAHTFHEEFFFTFVNKTNIFSNNHYELIRYPSYKRDWYSAVEKWRRGMVR